MPAPAVTSSYDLPDGTTVFVYDNGDKAYIKQHIPVDKLGNVLSGGSGGGGAVTVADGADIAEGSKADTAATDTTGSWTVISLLKGLLAAVKGTLAVTGTFWQAVQPVSGTFWQATQPVSVTSLPLPTGAAQDGTDATGVVAPTGATGIRGWLSSIYNKLNTAIAVTGTFWQATQPVSGTFWQATQPVSGAVTANAGTNLNTSALATETGNLAAAKTDLDTLAGIVSSGRAKATLYDVNGNVLLGDNTGTGTLTTTGDIIGPVRVDGRTVLWVQLVPASSPTGTVRVQGSLDGTTFFDIYAYQATAVATSGGPVLSLDPTGTNRYVVPIGGLQKVQVKANFLSGGTSAVTMNLGQGSLPYQPTILTGAKGRQASVNDTGALATAIVDGTSGTVANVDTNHALTVVPHDAAGNAFLVNPSATGQLGTDVLAAAPLLWSPQTSLFVPRFDNSWRTIFPVAARATVVQQNSSVITCQGRAGWIILICTAKAAATSLTMQVGGIESIGGGGFFGIAATASIAVGVNQMIGVIVGLGIAGTPNSTNFSAAPTIANVPMPGQILVAVTASDANSVTYGVEFCSF